MSRTTSRRLAAAAGVAVATAAAGAVLAAPAAAAELHSPTVSYPSTVAPGQPFAISGTGCFASPGGLDPAIILDSLDFEGGLGDDVNTDGTWALPFDEGFADLGTYHFSLTCDDYTGEKSYPDVVITVTPDGKPPATASAPAAPAVHAAPAAPAGTSVVPKPTAAEGCAICKALDSGKAVVPGQAMTLRYVVAPFQKITVVLHSTPRVLGTYTADAHGVVTIPLTIPADVLGSHSLTLVDEHGTTIAALPLKVVAKGTAASELAYTGADVALPLTLGGVLVVGGAGAVALGRRRAASARQASQA